MLEYPRVVGLSALGAVANKILILDDGWRVDDSAILVDAAVGIALSVGMALMEAPGLITGPHAGGARENRQNSAPPEPRQDDWTPAEFRRERLGPSSSARRPDQLLGHEEPVPCFESRCRHWSSSRHAAATGEQEPPGVEVLNAFAKPRHDWPLVSPAPGLRAPRCRAWSLGTWLEAVGWLEVEAARRVGRVLRAA